MKSLIYISFVVVFLCGCQTTGPSRDVLDDADPRQVEGARESQVAPSGTRNVVKIYTEIRYVIRYTEKKWFRNVTKTKEVTQIHKGTAFLLGRNRLITARHNIVGNRIGEIKRISDVDLDGKENRIESASYRVRISDMSFKPEYVLIHPALDVAILTLAAGDLQLLELINQHAVRSPPAIRMRVSVWGFPDGSIAPQLTELATAGPLTITSVEDTYFTISGGLEHGYSGGPVLIGNQCYGVVSRAASQHTRAVRIDSVLAQIRDFSRLPYVDGMQINIVGQK